MIASIFGQTSPLVLVLAGERQNTGKTEFFRRLLPPQLSNYYAESKLDGGKDDDILLTKKLIIMDDEFGGKSKLESKRFKELTSKASFSIRLPYGRTHRDLKRLAVLAGTTNDLGLISDPTKSSTTLLTNRRYLWLFMTYTNLALSGNYQQRILRNLTKIAMNLTLLILKLN
jgi:predicted P-loop ATPase